MKNQRRFYFRPLRKALRPWQPHSPDSLKKSPEVFPAPDGKGAIDTEWTPEEWHRIWRSISE